MNDPQFGTESNVVDRLIASDSQLETETATLISGQDLTRGALLGKITSGGKLNLSLSGAVDGSEVPYAVLAEDTDASAGDITEVPIYIMGAFNTNAMTIGTAHTVASVKDALRALGILLKGQVDVGGVLT